MGKQFYDYKYDEYKEYIENHGMKLLTNRESYRGSKTKLDFEDASGFRYQMKYTNFKENIIIRGSKLAKYTSLNPHTTYNIKKFYELNGGYYILDDDQVWVSNHGKLNFHDREGYRYSFTFNENNELKIIGDPDKGHDKFNAFNPFTFYNINLWLFKNNKEFEILEGQNYINEKQHLKFRCFRCHPDEIPFETTWDRIYHGGGGCSLCANCVMGKYNNLAYVRPDLEREWDYDKNFPVTPDKVAPRTASSYFWICLKCGLSYPAMVSNRNGPANSGCPKCNNSKGELKVRNFLTNNNIKFEIQKRFIKCRYKRSLPFDFYLSDYDICIEYQGKQHYVPFELFGGIESFEKVIKRDQIKKDFCESEGKKLIVISYKDMNYIDQILKTELNL